MPIYSFEETLDYFGDKLQAKPPEEDLEAGEAELVVDQYRVIISKGAIEGSINLQITLGLMMQPTREARFKELATGNFLGINTGGCSFALNGAALELRANVTPSSSPQESWEWLHRILHVAKEWNKNLVLWEEFIPLNKVKPHV